ncbi:MAG: divergent polysaccharide deacetylase family protein [Rhodobacterales bacterium]|nr:divergent polysaccharide deacetylase family protein [Rhodobacterales bacterium]
MVRGMLSGGFLGLVVVGAALSVASLMAPQPAGQEPPAAPQVEAPPEAQGGTTSPAATPEVVTAPTAPETAVAAEPAETPSAPAPEHTPTDEIADTSSAIIPDVLDAEVTIAPLTETAAPAVAPEAEAPVSASEQTLAPQVPAPEGDLTVATDPPAPQPVPEPAAVVEAPALAEPATDQPATAAPEATAQETATEDQPATEDTATAAPSADSSAATNQTPATLSPVESAPTPDTAPPPEVTADTPAVPAEEAAPETATPSAPVAEAATDALPALPNPVTESEPTEAADQSALPQVGDPAPEATATTEDPAMPQVVTLNDENETMPQVDTNVKINRPSNEPTTDAAPALAADPTDANVDTRPALVRFAAPFANPEGKPLMSVVLIDDGSLSGAASVVAQLPFPVTVAIDPAGSGAGPLIETYRAQGIEVMALARLPTGAVPTDVEITYEAVFRAMPDAIGVLDAGEGGLQSDSAVTDQAMSRLVTDGRGVVTLSDGLNMAARAAESAGVPAGTIEKDIDGEGHEPDAIRRALDQAAFRARQQSGVILLGRVKPDTLSSLMLWGSENEAGQIAMAPVSAILMAGQ